MNQYLLLLYFIGLLGIILIAQKKYKNEGVILILFSFIGLLLLMNPTKTENSLSYDNSLILRMNNNNIESFITGRTGDFSMCPNKDWIIDFDKAQNLKKICPLYKNCKKVGNEIFCNNVKIENYDEKLLECTQNYDLLNFIQNEWRNYCQNNSNNCLCIDLQDKTQKRQYIDNLKKWIDNMSDGQLKSWKIYLIDNLKLSFKKRNYLETKSHTHRNIQELIEHLKSLDKNIHSQVKNSIGIDEEVINSLYKNLINSRKKMLDNNLDQSGDNFIRINLTLQILESILENYEQIVFDKNATFLPENKCVEVESKVSSGLIKDDLNTLTKLTGECPKKHYLKGIRYERDIKNNRPQLKRIMTCCKTKKDDDNCQTINSSPTESINRFDITEISKLNGSCPKYHFMKSINFEEVNTEIINQDVVSLIANNNKFLYFNPVKFVPHYERVCENVSKWVSENETHRRCDRNNNCYNYNHPHWKYVDKIECHNELQGEFSAPSSGEVTTKNNSFYETYVNNNVKRYSREPIDNEKLIIEIRNDGKIAFKTTKNYYLTADPSSHNSTIRKIDKISIKSDDKYLSSNDNGAIVWNKTEVTDNEIFSLVNVEYKFIAIKNKDNKYLTANKVNVNQSSDISVGASASNKKVIKLPEAGFEPENTPINATYQNYPDRFDIKVSGKELIVKRIDSDIGWGQDLKIRVNLYNYNLSFDSSSIGENQKFNILHQKDINKDYIIFNNLYLTKDNNNAKLKHSIKSLSPYGWVSKFYFFNQGRTLPDINVLKQLTPNVERIDSSLNYRTTPSAWGGLHPRSNNFASYHITYFKAETTSYHWFSINSDDGSKLFIDGVLLINNDGLHGMRRKWSSKNLVKDQVYKIEVIFFEKGGWAGLEAKVYAPGIGYNSLVGTTENTLNYKQNITIEKRTEDNGISDNIITAHSPTVGEKQLFTLEVDSGDTSIVSLKAYNNKYVSITSDNQITFSSSVVGDTEKFKLIKKKELQQINKCCRAIKNEQCNIVYGPYTKGLDKDNILSLNTIDGKCPKNNYLKGLSIEKSENGDELRYKMNCCRTDLRDNQNATWDQMLSDNPPEYQPEPIEQEIDELVRTDLKKEFCHKHSYSKDDESDILHYNLQTDDTCKANTEYLPDLSKNQNNKYNDVEIFIESQNHYLNENIFLSKGQKLLFYLILLKIKNINHNLDYDKLYKFLDTRNNSNKNINLLNV